MTDDTDSSNDATEMRELYEEMVGAFQPMVETSFSADVSEEPEKEIEIAVRLTKAGYAFEEFLDYAEENDIDPTDISPREYEELDHEKRLMLLSFSSVSRAMVRFGEMFADDDDDDNPFKVSDGDDPVY